MPDVIDAQEYIEAELVEVAGAEQRYDGVHFERCTFVRCDFKEARFERCRFYECRFEKCDLSMAKVPRSAFREVELDGCKALGIDWQPANALLFDVAFVDCELSYCTFTGHRLRGLRMHDCRAREVDFSGCDLQEASFAGTDLAGARFSRTNLQKADLGDAVHVAFDPKDNRCGGTRISVDAGLQILGAMGLTV